MRHNQTRFERTRIELDGHAFRGCTFTRCTLVYRARAGLELSGCTFVDCDWAFEGLAGATLRLYRELASAPRTPPARGPGKHLH